MLYMICRKHVDVKLDGSRCVQIPEDLVVELGGLLSKEIAYKFGGGNLVVAVKVVE